MIQYYMYMFTWEGSFDDTFCCKCPGHLISVGVSVPGDAFTRSAYVIPGTGENVWPWAALNTGSLMGTA